MKFEDFANGNMKSEIIMFVINIFVASVAGLTLFFTEYWMFAPAVFFIVFLLQRINDLLLLQIK